MPADLILPGFVSTLTPQNVVALAGEGGVFVHFDPVPGAVRYTATARPSGRSVTRDVTIPNVAASPLVIGGLPNGQAHSVTLEAFCDDGRSASTTTTLAPAPRLLPKQLSTLPALTVLPTAWFDASQITGVTNGTTMQTWRDSSGNGFDATQASAGLRPTYRSTWHSTGRPAVQFDGTQTFLTSTMSSRHLGPEAWFIVAFSLAGLTGAGAGMQRLITQETERMDRGFALVTSNTPFGGGGNKRMCVIGANNSIHDSAAFNPGGGVGADLSLNQPYIFTAVCGGQLFCNGARQTPAGGGLPGLLSRDQGFSLGNMARQNAGNQPLNGWIATAAFFRGRPTDAQRWAWEAYLAAQYGLTVVQNTLS